MRTYCWKFSKHARFESTGRLWGWRLMWTRECLRVLIVPFHELPFFPRSKASIPHDAVGLWRNTWSAERQWHDGVQELWLIKRSSDSSNGPRLLRLPVGACGCLWVMSIQICRFSSCTTPLLSSSSALISFTPVSSMTICGTSITSHKHIHTHISVGWVRLHSMVYFADDVG